MHDPTDNFLVLMVHLAIRWMVENNDRDEAINLGRIMEELAPNLSPAGLEALDGYFRSISQEVKQKRQNEKAPT